MIDHRTERNTSNASQGEGVRDIAVDKESIEDPVELKESGMRRK